MFAGMQNLTLLDYPDTMACILFTPGCNFKCPFCHNASLVVREAQDDLKEDKIFSYLEKRKGILEGVVITGGEPLLHKDLERFLYKIREMGYRIKLDTNGSCPAPLRHIIGEGLVDYVAMDIKNSPNLYMKTIGIAHSGDALLGRINESIELLKDSVEHEFRTTVVKGLHTGESLVEIAKWIIGAKKYYLQQFVDSGDLISPEGLSAYSEEELKEFLAEIRKYIPNTYLRGITEDN